MKVLLIGGGGREHALAWKLAQSPKLEKLYIAPGNAGTAEIGENVPIPATDPDKLIEFAQANKIGFAVVGPDDPLAMGLVDKLEAAGIPAFGPNKAAAEIEASKAFSKRLMQKHGIPTAKFEVFRSFEPALEFAKKLGAPLVVKASGLALGKGVIICKTIGEAEQALRDMFVNKAFGPAGEEVVIEEFLEGPEISIHVLSDGKNYKLLPTSQDHKPAFDNDEGPNTGGMGTIVPLPWVNFAQMREIEEKIIVPVLSGMASENRTFKGLLYPGLKMTKNGPKVLEFNARFGDPETQSYMRLLKSDLLEALYACAAGTLDKANLEWENGAAACIVLASGGYPGKYEKGKEITGISEAEKIPGVKVFHAGTALKGGKLITSGGRVLGVTALGTNLAGALDLAYQAVKLISFEGMQYRTDIGAKSLKL